MTQDAGRRRRRRWDWVGVGVGGGGFGRQGQEATTKHSDVADAFGFFFFEFTDPPSPRLPRGDGMVVQWWCKQSQTRFPFSFPLVPPPPP